MPIETFIVSKNSIGSFVGDSTDVTDTQIKENQATTNYNNAVTIEATSWNVGDKAHSIIRFGGVTSAPAGTVVDARLGVYVTFTSGTPNDVGVYPMLLNVVFNQTNWNVSSTGNNWGTAGALGAGDIGTIVATFTNTGTTGAFVEFTGAGLIALAQDWLDGTNTILTVLLKQVIHTSHAADAFAYRSSEGADGQRPYLLLDIDTGGGGTDLVIADITHTVASDVLGLSSDTALIAADMLHQLTLDQMILSVESTIAIADVLHGHVLDSLNLTNDSTLAVADILHLVSADSPTLSADLALVISDILHGHVADSVNLSTAHALEIANLLHSVASDQVVLNTDLSVLISDILHTTAVDQLTLSTESTLVIADALHALRSDQVALGLSGVSNLEIADILHAVSADTLNLSSEIDLEVDSLLHGHSADPLILSLEASLIIADALHAHVLDAPVLNADLTLIIADVLHAHYADTVLLDLGNVSVVYGYASKKIIAVGVRRAALSSTIRAKNIQISRRR